MSPEGAGSCWGSLRSPGDTGATEQLLGTAAISQISCWDGWTAWPLVFPFIHRIMRLPHTTRGQQYYPLSKQAGFGVSVRKSWLVFSLEKNPVFSGNKAIAAVISHLAAPIWEGGSQCIGGNIWVWGGFPEPHCTAGNTPQPWKSLNLQYLRSHVTNLVCKGENILISKFTLCVMWCCWETTATESHDVISTVSGQSRISLWNENVQA